MTDITIIIITIIIIIYLACVRPHYLFFSHYKSKSHLRGRPWFRISHGWYFKIRCGSLSVSVHSPNMLYPFISVIFNFLYNWAYFKFWSNIFICSVILCCVFWLSPHIFHFRWHYPGIIVFYFCSSFAIVKWRRLCQRFICFRTSVFLDSRGLKISAKISCYV